MRGRFFLSLRNFEEAIAGGLAWRVRNRHRTRQIPQRRIQLLELLEMRRAMWGLPLWERPRPRPPEASLPSDHKPARPTNNGVVWCGAASRLSSARGSSPFFVFFFRALFSNLPRFSKSAIRRTTLSAWI